MIFENNQNKEDDDLISLSSAEEEGGQFDWGNWKNLEYVALLSVALGIPTIAMKAISTLRHLQFDSNCMMLFATAGAICLQD